MKTNSTKMNRIFLLISLLATALYSQPDEKPSKMNVLFIVADDMNCDIGAYGNKKVLTPNIDKLAKQGVLSGNAHNQYPWCGPSRASFMTGMYPDQTKVKALRIYLRQAVPKVVTIGQSFKKEN